MQNKDVSNDANLHRLAHKIANVIFEYVTTDDSNMTRPYLPDCRMTAVPVSARRTAGFILDFYRDKPIALLTPWGIWYCFGVTYRDSEDVWNTISSSLLDRFCTTKAGSDMGHRYVYLYEVDGEELPEPEDLGFIRRNEISGNMSRTVWNNLQAEYTKQIR